MSSNTHSLVNIATSAPRAGGEPAGGLRPGGCRPTTSCARSSISSRRAAPRLVGELPLLRRPALLRLARRRGGGGAAPARAGHGRGPPAERDRPQGPGPADAAGRAGSRAARPRISDVDPEALRASDAVIVNIDYPLGLAAYNILREVAVASSRAARRVRARQGGHARRRRGRRDDLERRTRRALTLDLLARQCLRGGGPHGRPALRQQARQPARGLGQEHIPSESRLPRLLLSGGVHGGGDGGRPYCNALYEIADPDRHPVGEAVNFSKLPLDFGIVHYASDTPYTRGPHARSARPVLLRPGFHLRSLAGDTAAGAAARGRCAESIRGRVEPSHAAGA